MLKSLVDALLEGVGTVFAAVVLGVLLVALVAVRELRRAMAVTLGACIAGLGAAILLLKLGVKSEGVVAGIVLLVLAAYTYAIGRVVGRAGLQNDYRGPDGDGGGDGA